MLPDGTGVDLFPELLRMSVGQSARAQVWDDDGRVGVGLEEEFFADVLPAAAGYISVTAGAGTVDVKCLQDTDGVIENAYEAIWSTGLTSVVNRFFGSSNYDHVRLLGDVDCVLEDGSTDSTDPPSEPPQKGEDATVDVEVDTGEKAPEGVGEAADIIFVSQVMNEAGDTCFLVDVVGDGEAAAADSSNYVIQIDVVEPEGGEWGEWQADVTYFRGALDPPPSVRLGENGPGRAPLEGAVVTSLVGRQRHSPHLRRWR